MLRLAFAGATEGERQVEGESCDALVESTVLVVAMAYDPWLVASPSGPMAPPTARATPGAPSSVDAVAPSPSASPPGSWPATAHVRSTGPTASRPAIGARLGAAGLAAILPRAALAFEGGLVVAWKRWRVILSALYAPPVASRLSDRPQAGGDLDVWTMGARGCARVWPAPADLAWPGPYAVLGCGGLAVGAMRADGVGVDEPGSGSALWLAPDLGAALHLSVGGSASLGLDVGAVIPLTAPNFVLRDLGEVHRPGVVAARLGVFVEAVF